MRIWTKIAMASAAGAASIALLFPGAASATTQPDCAAYGMNNTQNVVSACTTDNGLTTLRILGPSGQHLGDAAHISSQALTKDAPHFPAFDNTNAETLKIINADGSALIVKLPVFAPETQDRSPSAYHHVPKTLSAHHHVTRWIATPPKNETEPQAVNETPTPDAAPAPIAKQTPKAPENIPADQPPAAPTEASSSGIATFFAKAAKALVAPAKAIGQTLAITLTPLSFVSNFFVPAARAPIAAFDVRAAQNALFHDANFAQFARNFGKSSRPSSCPTMEPIAHNLGCYG